MKKLRQIHLYLGCLFAPVLIFFAVSGTWQLFDLHRSTKDGSYTAPKVLVILSDVHQNQHIPPTSSHNPTPLRYFMLAASFGLVITTILGIIMAFRFSRSSMPVVFCLLAGAAIPIAILFIYH